MKRWLLWRVLLFGLVLMSMLLPQHGQAAITPPLQPARLPSVSATDGQITMNYTFANAAATTQFRVSVTMAGMRVDNQIWLLNRWANIRIEATPNTLVSATAWLDLWAGDLRAVTSGETFGVIFYVSPYRQPLVPLILRVGEANGTITTAIVDQLYVSEINPPAVDPLQLPTTTATPFALQWSGYAQPEPSYDLEMRAVNATTWSRLMTNTPSTSTFIHTPGLGTYVFRLRSRDNFGRISPWSPEAQTTITRIDHASALLLINRGALSTNSPNVNLEFAGYPLQPSVASIRLSEDGLTWQAWQPYRATIPYLLTRSGRNTIYVQLRDRQGTISAPLQASIEFNPEIPSDVLATINNQAIFTNDANVTITTGGPAQATHIQLSNDGSFANAVWQPFANRTSWRISTYGSFALPRTVYVRVRTSNGTIIGPVTDDIIYDPLPPTGSISVAAQTRSAIKIELAASDPDGISGLGGMRVGTPEQFAVTAWEPFAANKTLAVSNTTALQPIYAQFRDNANNMTPILCVTPAGAACGLTPRTYLSFIAQ